MVFVEYTNNIFKIDSLNLSEIESLTKQKLNITDFYFTTSGKIVSNNTILKDNDILNVNLRLNGGFQKILEKVLNPIVKPFKEIAMAVVGILELVVELALLIPKILELIMNIFTPDKIINDVIFGITKGIKLMLNTLFGGISSRPKKSDNSDAGSHLFGSSKKTDVVCMKPTTMNLIILILCPPLALLLNEGIKAWYLIIICALMTYYLFYIPGFIFAALHILC